MGDPQESADHILRTAITDYLHINDFPVLIPVYASLLIPDLLNPVTMTEVFARIKGQAPCLHSESHSCQLPPGLCSFNYSVLLYQQSLPLSSTHKHALAFLLILINPPLSSQTPPATVSFFCFLLQTKFFKNCLHNSIKLENKTNQTK